MKTQCAALLVLIAIALPASAQDHLEPDPSALVEHNVRYPRMLRDVFAPAFEGEVTSRAIVIPHLEVEYAVGLRTTRTGVEAFLFKASSSVMDVAELKRYEAGEAGTLDRAGKTVPLEKDESYQELKKSTPTHDHRKIKLERRARAIPADLAARIDALWQAMLLGVRYPDGQNDVVHGVLYHFSAPRRSPGILEGFGWPLSGQVVSPDPDSKTGRLVALTGALADYASGKADLKRLTEQVDRATKP